MHHLGLSFQLLDDLEAIVHHHRLNGKCEIRCSHDIDTSYRLEIIFHPAGDPYKLAIVAKLLRNQATVMNILSWREGILQKFESHILNKLKGAP